MKEKKKKKKKKLFFGFVGMTALVRRTREFEAISLERMIELETGLRWSGAAQALFRQA